MRHHSKLMLALAMSVLALGPMACTSSSWCADCEQATAILGLNYQPVNTYTVGTAIPVNPPNPSGGTPRIYTVDSGILPPGLSLDPATGRITGTPTAAGVYTLTIRGANSANSASQTIQITVVPAQPLGLGYATPQVFPAASAIAMQNPVLAQATPGLATIYAITAGSLPAGLTLNADGTISGTPTAPGVFPFTVTATNGTRTATASATYTVTPAGSLGLTYATPKVFGAGLAITAQGAALLNPTPGVPTTYAVTTGALPAGLALSATNGDITGTPTAPGVFPFTVTATNGTRTAASSPAYTVTPAAALALAYATPQTFTSGTAIGTQVATLSNPTPGVVTTYALTGGTFPPGLSLDPATGGITGTPTTPGVYTFTATATNGTRNASATATYTVVPVGALGLDYTSPQTFTAGSAIATQMPSVTNPTPGLTTTFAVTSDALPGGLTLNPDGTITGTPTTPGVYAFTVTATNGARTATSSPTYTVTPAAALAVDYSTPQTFTAGTAIAAQAPVLSNPTPGVATTYAVTAGTLPVGLTLNADGTITGTPIAPGVYGFTVTATNGTRTATSSPSYTVVPAAALTVDYSTPQTFTTGTAIATQAPVLANPTSNVATTYAVTAGALPDGLTLNADGTITGTPTAPGVYAFTITATNGTRVATSSPTYTVTPAAALALTYATPQTYPVGTAITTQAAGLGNATPGLNTTYVLTSGSLPAGLTLDAGTGNILGTPTAPGVYTFTITATNGGRSALSNATTYTVNPASNLTVGYASPQTFPVGSAIATQNPTLANANPGLTTTYAISSGSLPAGLTLNSDGTITGTPTTAGVYTFVITATNGTRTPAVSGTVTYTVNPASNLTVSYVSPRTFPVGSAIGTQSPTLANANPGLTTTYVISSGSLPAGLTLNSDGTITGTPTTAGVYTFAITATNGTRTPAVSGTVTYTVNPASNLTVGYASPQTFPVGSAIATQNPTLANANPGLTTTYAISSGSLPAGLTLNSDGTITGTPTTAGVYTFVITATNGTRTPAVSGTVTYTVNPASNLTVSYVSPRTFPVGSAIGTQSPTLANANPGLTTTYVISSGSLPAGLTLNSDGTITGTPTTAGVYTFAITATNGTRTPAVSNTVTYTVPALAPTALNYTSPITYTASLAIANNNPNPTGGAPTAYSIAGGSLPAGLSLDPATGVISGTPTVGGSFSVTISGSNSTGGTSQTLSITVLAYPTANLSSNPSTVPIGQSSSLTVLFTGSASGTALLTGDGIVTPLTVTSGTSVPTGIVNVPGTLRTYTLTVTNAQGYTATSQTTVQWIPVPLDTWTVTLPTTGGGPLTPGSGNLLQGQIAITVPDQGQSLCGDVTLTVNKEASLPGAIVAAARDYSHTFNIASNLGYPFRVPITITLAYDPTLASPSLTGTDLPMAFYWDPSYSKWVATGLKAVDTTAHTVTFTTLLPGRYAVLGVPSLAVATQNLGFASGTDDWRQNNPSVYDLPGGASLGMSSFASWFFPFGKPANGGTGLFNQFPTVGDANAAALISRLANGTMDSWEALWNQGTYTLTDRQTGLALLTGLMVTGQPQVFLMSDARPAINNGLATAVYGYDNATGRFKVMDPNYPGNALTIAWSAGSGFSSYDRAAGYSPALAKYAFEGQTSVHRLADYDRVLSGAATSFPAATFATINVTNVAEVPSPNLAQDVVVTSANNVTVSGTVTNGDEAASHIYWSQNGSAPRTAVPLVGNAFTFTIPALADPYATTVTLETTSTPCDPSFSHSGFAKFVVKQSSLTPWFTNSCFENGQANPAPWVLEQGFNGSSVAAVPYPTPQTFSTTTGQMNSYSISWNQAAVDSALVHSAAHAADANVPAIASVLDGDYSFMVNNPANGAHISRMYETITVPTTVANPKLTFYWAAAMQSAGHVPAQLPYVDILVQDVTNNYEVLYFVHHYPPSTVGATTYTDGYPGWIAGNGTGANQWYGINWQKVGLNLGASRQGHQLKITVMAADCNQGGHGGYAYIDNIGCN
ncbi:beta strand repeat-containing protein [Geothrix sp.]|uniref:beta strand repeat-containing protein n=1 Tax=Geothrix sp. TaxID=1962974 RepID=UPI00260F27D3|nr:putative Ig domain-containing protein [Geothrix sp.]WIL21577.1 MAG: putative Ig domain-containing protein [Geothrix sp.]